MLKILYSRKKKLIYLFVIHDYKLYNKCVKSPGERASERAFLLFISDVEVGV